MSAQELEAVKVQDSQAKLDYLLSCRYELEDEGLSQSVIDERIGEIRAKLFPCALLLMMM